MELLIRHGANVNSRTASGNTPLHICVLENQIKCVRVLLLHGADYNILNYAQQSAYDVSILVNHFEIGQLLHKVDNSDEYVPELDHDKEPDSDSALDTNLHHSSIASKENENSPEKQRKASKESLGDLDDASDSESDYDDEKLKPLKQCRTFSNGGVGTKRSPAPMKIKPIGTPTVRKRLYASVLGRQFLVINDYEPKHSGELALKQGDLLEVLYIGDNGFWEGHIQGRDGWFPSYCVQEIKHNENILTRQLSWFGKKNSAEDSNKFVNMQLPTPRSVILKRSEKGFGFQLRGANSHVPYIDFVPTPQYPALQYIGDVDKGGVAERAGLKAGDFVLEINNENVISATHGYSVSLISKGSKTLSIKVISVAPESVNPELVLPNGTLKPVDTVDVGENVLNELNTAETNKGGPPAPPMRSFATVLSTTSRVDPDASVLSEGSVATTAETVAFGNTTVNRKSSVKGIWSGNAFRLQGNDIKIREDDISRGISRKQKGISTDKVSAYDERCKGAVSAPSVSADSSFENDLKLNGKCYEDSKEQQFVNNANLNYRPEYRNCLTYKKELPDYKAAVNSLQGRTNSLGKEDGAKLSRSHTLDLDYGYDGESRGKLGWKNNGSIHSNLPQEVKPDTSETYNQQHIENQQYATVRKHNHVILKQGVNKIDPPMNDYPTYKFPMPTVQQSHSDHSEMPRIENLISKVNYFDQFHHSERDCIPSSEKVCEKQTFPQMKYDQKSVNKCDDSGIHIRKSPELCTSIPYSHPPESDGLVRLQSQRQVLGHQKQMHPIAVKMEAEQVSTAFIRQQIEEPLNSNHYNSVSNANLNNDYQVNLSKVNPLKPDRILQASNILGNPHTSSSHSNEDSATSYLDVVIADAEASINYDIISLASSSVSHNDIESSRSDAKSVLSSPNSSTDGIAQDILDPEGNEFGYNENTMIEFPPPPDEFLAEDEIPNKDTEDKVRFCYFIYNWD